MKKLGARVHVVECINYLVGDPVSRLAWSRNTTLQITLQSLAQILSYDLLDVRLRRHIAAPFFKLGVEHLGKPFSATEAGGSERQRDLTTPSRRQSSTEVIDPALSRDVGALSEIEPKINDAGSKYAANFKGLHSALADGAVHCGPRSGSFPY